MYWCNECNRAYPDKDIELIDASEDEEWTICGHCGGTDISHVDECKCGKWKNASEEFCENCKEYLRDRATDAVEGFMNVLKCGSEWKAKEELKDFLDDIYGR